MSGVSAEMPRYKCHKEVHALKIQGIGQGTSATKGGSWLIVPEDKGYAPFEVPHEWYTKHAPKVGGYYVVYSDGYSSFSPAKAFEEGYSRI